MLLSTVPSHKQAEILDRTDEYTSIQQHWEYKYNCGVPLGTPEHQINNSPFLLEEEVIDWHKLFELILTALEECGTTWKFEKWTVEVGGVEKDKPVPPPNPIFSNTFKQLHNLPSEELQNEQNEEPKKYKHPCAICDNHVFPGTGKYFMHRLVHKKDCLAIAKTKWGDGKVQ